jgi:hypothetical protein
MPRDCGIIPQAGASAVTRASMRHARYTVVQADDLAVHDRPTEGRGPRVRLAEVQRIRVAGDIALRALGLGFDAPLPCGGLPELQTEFDLWPPRSMLADKQKAPHARGLRGRRSA